jgi:drug/metabolite transporter (DMT)-like permease
VALAVSVFVINQLATISTVLVSPVILFTFINGGGTVISTLVAAVVYKEKICKKTAVGIIAGIASLVIIKMFQQ